MTDVKDEYGLEAILDGRPLPLGMVDGQPADVAVLPIAKANAWVERVRKELAPLQRAAAMAATAAQIAQRAEAAATDAERMQRASETADALEAMQAADDACYRKVQHLVDAYLVEAGAEELRGRLRPAQLSWAFTRIMQVVDPTQAVQLLRSFNRGTAKR